MPVVLTVDQIGSRRGEDLVEAALARLAPLATVLPFTRTVGDEFQGVPDHPLSAVDAIVDLMRTERWHIGVGIGAIDAPWPDDPRAARGSALLAARRAVERAKSSPTHLAVESAAAPDHEDSDLESVLRLLAAVLARRTDEGWQVVDLTREGLTQAEVAARLGITRQAVGQRLRSSQWAAEEAVRPVLARMLGRAEDAAA